MGTLPRAMESFSLSGVKNGAGRPVTTMGQLKGMLESIVDGSKLIDTGAKLVLEVSNAQEKERQAIHAMLEQVRQNEKNCVLVYSSERKTYATEGAIVGSTLGAVAGVAGGFAAGVAVGAGCVGTACPPLAPVSLGLIVGGLAAGALITKATVIVVSVHKDKVVVEATTQKMC